MLVSLRKLLLTVVQHSHLKMDAGLAARENCIPCAPSASTPWRDCPCDCANRPTRANNKPQPNAHSTLQNAPPTNESPSTNKTPPQMPSPAIKARNLAKKMFRIWARATPRPCEALLTVRETIDFWGSRPSSRSAYPFWTKSRFFPKHLCSPPWVVLKVFPFLLFRQLWEITD